MHERVNNLDLDALNSRSSAQPDTSFYRDADMYFAVRLDEDASMLGGYIMEQRRLVLVSILVI